MRDALIVHHRLPKVWDRFVTTPAGQVEAKRIRQVAGLMVGQPVDVCRAVDAALAPLIDRLGPVKVEDKVNDVIDQLNVEALEYEIEDNKEGDHVTLDENGAGGAARTGRASLQATGDWKDLRDLNITITLIAELLKQRGDLDPLGTRRVKALGMLADPHRAAAFLDGLTDDELPTPSGRAKDTTLYVTIPLGVLVGLYTMGSCEALGPMLEALVRAWCGRSDTNLSVKPVIDLNEHLRSRGYQPSDRLREQTVLINPTCVFPNCTRPARRCDQDHIVPHSDDPGGGPTCSCNLAPKCRHHHNCKTHAGWSYTRLDETTFLWTDPHGLRYLRDHTGTRPLDDH